MKYSTYIDSLDGILRTGKSNQAMADAGQQQLYPALEENLAAAGGLSEKEGKSLREIIQTLFEICSDSPLLSGSDAPQLLSALFRASADPPDVGQLPLVLSGPMVRRAVPEAVTVWLALKQEETVMLSVFEDLNGTRGNQVLSGQGPTVKLGNNLHVTAVTATPAAGDKPLQYGKSYLYELAFQNQQHTLSTLGLAAALAYAGGTLPSFMLPPEQTNAIHLIHSSCRNLTNESYDALPALDSLLAAEWRGQRPQQLFLSGDQIYADEANEVLEHLYISVGNTLLSGLAPDGSFLGPEKMRRQEDEAPDVCPADIIPGERGHMHKVKEFRINNRHQSFVDLLREQAGIAHYPPEYPGQDDTADCIHELCGFTPTSRFHLLSLADFFGLYLLNWSEVLWPAFFRDPEVKLWAVQLSLAHKKGEEGNLLGRLQAGRSTLAGLEKQFLEKLNNGSQAKNKACVEAAYALKHFRLVLGNFEEMLNMVIFAAELGKVRRVLANIATYMMFDDHEVTDDWHMTREWVHRVYSKPMGRRVLQNALAAYAVFQSWGNTPARFESGKPGGKLLAALSTWIASQYTDQASEQLIGNALKIPNKAHVAKYRAIGAGDTFPDIFDEPLAWDYRVDHPRYEVLVLDARTFRSFPGSLYGAADHLSAKALQAQLPEPAALPPPFSDKPRELTFVISPCNVVTIPLFRNYLSQVALPLAHYFTGYKGLRWEMAAYDPDQADSWEAGTPLFESFLSRLALRTAKQQPEARSLNHVVVLSGDVHFSYAGRLAYWAQKPLGADQPKAHEMVVAHLTASGMKNEAGAWKKLKLDLLGYEFTDLGSTATRLPEPEVMIGYGQAPAALDQGKQDEIVLRTRWFPNYKPGQITRKPILLPAHKIHPDVKLPPPEWMYRMDFIRGTREKELENINTISHFHFARDQAPSAEIIRRSNFAAITIDWEGEAQLTQPLDAKADTFTALLTPGKAFPRPPFFVTIDQEILYVLKTEVPTGSEAEIRFLKVNRGRSDTKAQAHARQAVVKVRRAVTQTNWLVAEVPLKAAGTPPETTAPTLVSSPLTRFKVPMAIDDPQFPKPSPNTL